MVRHRITDDQWECIAGVFPPPKATGRPRANLRNVVDSVLWILCTGAQWRDLPQAEFGAWETVYCWFNRWTSDGTLDEIVRRLQAALAETESFDHELWCIDGSVVRAHRCAAGGGKKAIRANRKITPSAAVAAGFRPNSTSSATAPGNRCMSR